jgi:hypothetical protein
MTRRRCRQRTRLPNGGPSVPAIPPIAPPAIRHPTAPAPPTGALPPQASPIPDYDELAQKLARKLHEGKRDEALAEVKALDPDARDSLEVVLIALLSAGKQLSAQRHALQRLIRFARHPPEAPPASQPFKATGGTVRSKVPVAGGAVVLRTGVTFESKAFAANTKEAYSLTFKADSDGSKAAKPMRWLQFIWRMVVPEFPGTPAKRLTRPVQMRLDSKSQRPYHLTRDTAHPHWVVDSASSRSAYFDENGSPIERQDHLLTMVDSPSPMPAQIATSYFTNSTTMTGEKLQEAPDKLTAHFVAATYLVSGMDVLYRADIHLTWTFTKATAQSGTRPPVSVLGKPQGKVVSELDAAHRARLAYQWPDFDYLPGAIGLPALEDAFELVSNLGSGSSDKQTNVDKVAEVATLARAELIDAVPETPSSSLVSEPSGAKPGPADVKPGLNFAASLKDPEANGETGYVDQKGRYDRPPIPTALRGPLPGIAMILVDSAFTWGTARTPRNKDFPLAVMRHEMTHAAHYQLAVAWLLKWREELTSTPFLKWLRQERDAKRCSPLALALVSTYLSTPLDKRATEALAHTETFLTGVPFLPASPDIAHLKEKATWPAALGGLIGAGEWHGHLSRNSTIDVDGDVVHEAIRQRVRDIACDTLTQVQRDTLIAWLDALLDPDSLDPNHGNVTLIKEIKAFFDPVRQFLVEIRAEVKRPCPK